MKRSFITAIIVSSLVLSFGSAFAQGSKRTVVRLDYTGSVYATTSVVGVEKGFFEEEGLLVNPRPQASGPIAVQSLIGGSTDFAVGSNVQPVLSIAAGVPVKVVALNTYGFAGNVIVPVDDTKSSTMQDLKGKVVGVQVGSGTHTVWLRYLKHIGMSEKDFKIKNMDTVLIPAAFESKSIEAAVAWDPFATLIVEKKLGRVMLGPKDIADPVRATYAFYLMTTDEIIKKKSDMVQRFINGWVKGIRFIEKNRDEVAEIMHSFFAREGLKLSPVTVKAVLSGSRYDRAVVSEEDINDTMENAKILHETGRLKKLADFKTAVDNSFVEKALKGR
jgi:sulfonate transport system substrate-binding protein